MGDGELDGLDAAEVMLIGHVQTAGALRRGLPRQLGDGVHGVGHKVDRHHVGQALAIIRQATAQIAVDERVEDEQVLVAF